MRFDYWTVRLVPDVFGLTTYGVGVIVANPGTGETRNRFRNVEPLLRRHENKGELATALKRVVKDVQKSQDEPAALDLGGSLSVTGRLDIAAKHWMNEVRVDPRKPVEAQSIDAALEVLYSTLICCDEASPSRTSKSVTQLRKEVRATYEKLPNLREATWVEPVVDLSLWMMDLNLAVVDNEKVIELNQVFNFHTSQTDKLEKDVDSWTLKVDKLRNDGGTLNGADRHAVIATDTGITSPVLVPSEGEQLDLFEAFKSKADKLDIVVVPVEKIGQHAARIEDSLVA